MLEGAGARCWGCPLWIFRASRDVTRRRRESWGWSAGFGKRAGDNMAKLIRAGLLQLCTLAFAFQAVLAVSSEGAGGVLVDAMLAPVAAPFASTWLEKERGGRRRRGSSGRLCLSSPPTPLQLGWRGSFSKRR